MNYKELCKKTENNRYSEIAGIKNEKVILEGKPLKKIKDNWIIMLLIIAVTVGFLLIKFNIVYFLICIALLVFFVMLFIYGNTYTITCNKDDIHIKQGLQKFNIPYKSIKNVYISKTAGLTFLRTYVLVVRCEDSLKLLREFEFPLLCTNYEQVSNFINNFIIKNEKNEKYFIYEKRRSLRRIIENIFTAFVVIIIILFMFSKRYHKFLMINII